MNTIKNSKALFLKIQEKAKDGESQLSIRELLPSKPLSSDRINLLKNLVSLVEKQKLMIRLPNSKKDPIQFILLEATQKPMEKGGVSHLAFWALLVDNLFDSCTWNQFHRLSQEQFKSNKLVEFLVQNKAEFTQLLILSRYISNFFANSFPLSVHDLGLSERQVLDLYQKVRVGDHFLQEFGLIKFTNCTSLYLESELQPKLLQLLNGQSITNNGQNPREFKGYHQEIGWDKIRACTLQLKPLEEKQFRSFERIIQNRKSTLTVLLYGKPGTGKTEWVYQLAYKTQAQLLQLNFSNIHSKWYGETEKNIHTVFERYRQLKRNSKAPVILLINEADGLLSRRLSVSTSNDASHNRIQSVLLELLENFEGVLFATTNLVQALDEAYDRRFVFKFEMSPPDREQRIRMMEQSPYLKILPESFRSRLEEGYWTAGDFKRMERKLALFEPDDDLDLLWNLIEQEKEMLGEQPKIGFSLRPSTS